jgi:uncharacterized membrane protein YidH (DUF202 family)
MSLLSIGRVVAAITKDQVDIPQNGLAPGSGGIVQRALQLFFGIAGAVAVLMVALGAFRYVISRGDPGAIKTAKETIIYAAVGLVITITGYGLVSFVVTKI